jgi:hypothetical protein
MAISGSLADGATLPAAMLDCQREFNPSGNQWVWMDGDSKFGDHFDHGTYGELGKFAPGNIPGSRWEGATWTDTSGNFWLFGGQGNASVVTEGILNDLWEFNPSTNQWAWMGGSSTLNCANVPHVYCNRPGVYGTLGVPAAGNNPWKPHGLFQLEGRQWKPLTLWRPRLRFQFELEHSQRSLEVQSFDESMGMDGRDQHAYQCSDGRRSIRHTRNSCCEQSARTQIRRCQLDR